MNNEDKSFRVRFIYSYGGNARSDEFMTITSKSSNIGHLQKLATEKAQEKFPSAEIDVKLIQEIGDEK